MQNTAASRIIASAVSVARTLLRLRFFRARSNNFIGVQATLANTSETRIERAFNAGTMPPSSAVRAPRAGPHQKTCFGTKNTGKNAIGILMPPARWLMSARSEERRVGKEWRCAWVPDHAERKDGRRK